MDGTSEALIAKLTAVQEALNAQKARADLAEEQVRREIEKTHKTTLPEVLEACHNLAQSFKVQLNPSLSTKGSKTRNTGKRCPQTLAPWTAFPQLRQEAFDKLSSILYPSEHLAPRLFPPRLFFDELRGSLSRSIASEQDLRFYQQTAVEAFVEQIISQLMADPQIKKHLTHRSPDNVTFENHPNSLNDPSTESKSQDKYMPRPKHADQICVTKDEAGQREVVFVIEYKAPHKLTNGALQTGLHQMDVPAICNRSTIPIEKSAKFKHDAEELVVAAITQTYSYMLECGTGFGCVVTGEAMVFLQIPHNDANTVFYDLAIPNQDVSSLQEVSSAISLTAVGQLCNFCLIAFQSRPRDQIWRDKALIGPTRGRDIDTILESIPPEDLHPTPPSSFHRPPHT